MFRRLLASLACVAAAACASTAADDASAAFASLHFEKGLTTNTGVHVGARQEYAIVASDGRSHEEAAAFDFLNSNRSQIRRVAADRTVSVVATVRYYDLTIPLSARTAERHSRMDNARCNALARFTPAPGRTYRVVQSELSLGVCELRITDAETGAPPDDLDVSNAIEAQP